MKDIKEKIFEKVVTDYGKNVLKLLQSPKHSRVVEDIIKQNSAKDIEIIIKKLMNYIKS